MSILLGIETSCDETGIAIVQDGKHILANEVASQIDIHKEFGGVVPEIASRQHTTIISHLTQKALENAGFDKQPQKHIDAIAVTQGPGLMGALLVGMSFAKGLAYAWAKPFVPVHHIEGHLYSTFLCENPPKFPFLALIVSGGHTQLIQCPKPHTYQILGATRDDAVGESFDKVARLLGLPYPGGPAIQQAATTGNPNAFKLPRPMLNTPNLEFSYSGLKTAVLYTLRKNKNANTEDMAASFQQAAIDILLSKTKQAIKMTGAKRLVVAGGVAANQHLRQRLQTEINLDLHIPPLKYCIDNGAMIAAAGHARLQQGLQTDLTITPKPNLPLESKVTAQT